jgi:hypothetical protein
MANPDLICYEMRHTRGCHVMLLDVLLRMDQMTHVVMGTDCLRCQVHLAGFDVRLFTSLIKPTLDVFGPGLRDCGKA